MGSGTFFSCYSSGVGLTGGSVHAYNVQLCRSVVTWVIDKFDESVVWLSSIPTPVTIGLQLRPKFQLPDHAGTSVWLRKGSQNRTQQSMASHGHYMLPLLLVCAFEVLCHSHAERASYL